MKSALCEVSIETHGRMMSAYSPWSRAGLLNIAMKVYDGGEKFTLRIGAPRELPNGHKIGMLANGQRYEIDAPKVAYVSTCLECTHGLTEFDREQFDCPYCGNRLLVKP